MKKWIVTDFSCRVRQCDSKADAAAYLRAYPELSAMKITVVHGKNWGKVILPDHEVIRVHFSTFKRGERPFFEDALIRTFFIPDTDKEIREWEEAMGEDL